MMLYDNIALWEYLTMENSRITCALIEKALFSKWRQTVVQRFLSLKAFYRKISSLLKEISIQTNQILINSANLMIWDHMTTKPARKPAREMTTKSARKTNKMADGMKKRE